MAVREVPEGAETRRPATVRTLIEHGIDVLGRSGISEPRVDVEVLAGFVLGASRGRIQAMVATDASVEPPEAAALVEALERRSKREPLQHILGVAWFRHLELSVGPGVFVPRPETEFVAGLAIDSLRAFAGGPDDAEGPLAVDLGTGSGAIALSLATEVPHSRVIAVENSSEAFVWTEQNFSAVGADNAQLVFADLADALPELDGCASVVVSNPPYIPSAAVPRDPEVRLFDPEHALYGGEDGLDVVRQVSHTARRLLRPGGVLVLEHGEVQGDDIRALLLADGWRAPSTHRDLTARDRATVALR